MATIIRKNAYVLIILLFFFAFSFRPESLANAQSDDYILEVEQHWETYTIGGTCIPGAHNLAVADVDGDNELEMITGGFSYLLVNGSRATFEAPLKIWSWDGQHLILEKGEKWNGSVWCVYAGDADGDGKTEIITSGNVADTTGYCLRIWTWDGDTLLLKGEYAGISAAAISVCDVDLDNEPEIITVNRPLNVSQSAGQLCVWHWDGSSLKLESSAEWGGSEGARANSVCTFDLDNDGVVEIVTGGYANDLENSSGQLRVWQYDGMTLSMKANEEWRLVEGVYALTTVGGIQGNTIVTNVKVGDVDGDSTPEIVTGGFAYDGENVNAQLRIWNWDGATISLEKSEEWTTDYITEIKCISLNDIDGDSKIEIVTSGVVAAKWDATGPERAQLRVWRWDGTTLTLKQNKDWVIGDGVCAWSVATGDVDGDGAVEVVTVGCMYVDVLCDPDLRIWSLPVAQFPFLLVAGTVAGVASALVATHLLMRKRRRGTQLK